MGCYNPGQTEILGTPKEIAPTFLSEMALFIFRDSPSSQINVDRLLSLGGLKSTLNWGWREGGEDTVHFPAKQ